MVRKKNSSITDIIKSFEICREKIQSHIHELKLISSDEILNGSLEEAQKILAKISPVEISANKLLEFHDEFISTIQSVNIQSNGSGDNGELSNQSKSAKVSGERVSNNLRNFKSTESFVSQIEFRLSILKALIYLGGSAHVNDVMKFIEKDMRKKLQESDFQIPKGDELKRWEKMVKQEREIMEAKGLVNENASTGVWEIAQTGIDYLSNHGK